MTSEPEKRIGLTIGSWMLIRQAFLMLVDALERELDIEPRTAELRKERKAANKPQ